MLAILHSSLTAVNPPHAINNQNPKNLLVKQHSKNRHVVRALELTKQGLYSLAISKPPLIPLIKHNF